MRFGQHRGAGRSAVRDRRKGGSRPADRPGDRGHDHLRPGLPPAIEAVGIGGAIDVAFLGRTAYVLVTLVGPSLGQPSVVDGLYRVGRDGTVKPVADIGAWSIEHPPAVDVEVPSGVQYAMQRFGRGFLVSDGHHNRIIGSPAR